TDSLSEPPAASGSSVGPQPVGSLPLEDGCTKKSTTITVSRKQNWAKFTWGSQEDSHNRKPCQSSSSTSQGPAGQDEAPSQESLHHVDLVASGPKEDAELPVGFVESSSSSLISAKCSSQGAYLQSLERSSRHWVLSSGKTQGMEEPTATSSSTELKELHVLYSNEGEIWYNPIPEDEDLHLPGLEKKWGGGTDNRSRRGKPVEIKAGREVICLGSSQQARRDGFQTSPSQMRPAKQVEEMSISQPQACGGKVLSASTDPEERAMAPVSMAQSPTTHKKVHTLGKAKSPGPVRSLSMKMKKLPELRRKLSLRSSRPRGPEPEGSSSPKESGSVISRYHLDSCRTQQLAMQLEPQGLLYIKLTLVDQWDPASNDREPQVFGVNLSQLVEREGAAIKVPLLIQKCVTQIEQRGLKVVGLYRLCGSAAVKKELRDAFEKDSSAVVLSEDLYPDINVITGILKDYLRELPTPLITNPLYQVVLEAMSSRTVGQEAKETSATTALLDCLPEAEKNLAVCFGPVLLSQGAGGPGVRSPNQRHHTIASTMDFKHHIEVLHYLLQAWPTPRRRTEEEHPLPQRPCRPSLHLPLLQTTVVARSRPRGLESPPSNRYAGDWSVCGQQFLAGPKPGIGDTDYDEVAGSESDNDEERNEEEALREEGLAHHSQTVFMGDFALVEEPDAPFSPRLNLKDFDALILDLERELSKQINVCL
ncbi:hypothetical protein JD844_010000, partial [Phrynosoma platyrhinos]